MALETTYRMNYIVCILYIIIRQDISQNIFSWGPKICKDLRIGMGLNYVLIPLLAQNHDFSIYLNI